MAQLPSYQKSVLTAVIESMLKMDPDGEDGGGGGGSAQFGQQNIGMNSTNS